jgi:DNA-binding CsgD family transcriptional regulator
MEFATELKACLLSLHAKVTPDSITNLMSDQVLVETPMISAVGRKPLIQAFYDYIQHPAYRGYQLDQIIEQEHAIRVIGKIKALSEANKAGAYIETTLLFNHFLLFLFDGPKTVEHLTHVILHTDFYSSPLFQETLPQTHPDHKTLIKELTQIAANQFNQRLTSTHLTLREIQCLSLYIHCKSTKEIAPVLSVSHRTVETHINNILRKLGCVTKSRLFKLAHDEGCIPLLYQLQNSLVDYSQHNKSQRHETVLLEAV